MRADRVIVSWFGVGSLAVAVRARVVLLDSYVNGTRVADCAGPRPGAPPGYVPTTYAALAALRPEAIFVGHGHFDHACRTGELLARTGATLVGLPEHCALARGQARGFRGRPVRIRCVRALPSASAFGATRTLRPLGDAIRVTAVRNLHSGRASDPPLTTQGAESVLYRFGVGELSFAWHDTTGPLREHAPALRTALRRLPATDVAFGASLGLGAAEQGYRDPVDYADALRVRRFYAIHQDFTSTDGSSRSQRPAVRAAFAGHAELRWLQDPGDYLRPIVLDPRDRRWGR